MKSKTLITALALMLASAFSARADHIGTVTLEEAAQGWVGLMDGETLFGWNQLGDAGWKIENGHIVCESGTGGWLASTARFADFELMIKIKVKANTSAGVVFRARLDGAPTENGTGIIVIDEPKEGGSADHEVHVVAEGDKITAHLDGKDVAGVKVGNALGHIGIQYFGNHFHKNRIPGRIEVSSAKLRPLGLKPIFNGTDLSEWNVIPGKKSVFSVVDGAINIKNGNGQIESKGTYKDFALQLAIISNGKHLNSGVFYRGPVGVFWKGYESQVRNHWTGDDRAKPVDFGTGGNYGNQNARKVVSTDGEWFYKTIIADGNHASVWINGYLASDFTDVRPPSPENDGKGGYVAGPGTIHLQGHDPTTDLSFKDIKLAPYPEK